VVSLGLALHVCQRDRIPVDIVFRAAPWLVQHNGFLPFVGDVYISTMKHLLPYCNAVRINGPVLVRPITPTGVRVRPGDLVVLDFRQRIAPMYDRSRVIALQDIYMRVPLLLVGHRFAVPAERASLSTGFQELVRIPLVVSRHPCRNIVGSLPEDQPDRGLIEPHHHIGVRTDPPHSIPGILVVQSGIVRTEWPCSRWSRRHFLPRKHVSLRSLDGGIRTGYFLRTAGLFKHLNIAHDSI